LTKATKETYSVRRVGHKTTPKEQYVCRILQRRAVALIGSGRLDRATALPGAISSVSAYSSHRPPFRL